jgi:DNA adenine methylase
MNFVTRANCASDRKRKETGVALIRYPGSKEKLVREITDRFPDQMRHELWSKGKPWEYREPFFGAGAIGFGVLKSLNPSCRVWLNDIDPGIVALWMSVRDHAEALSRRVMEFTPTTDAFYRFKEEDGHTDLPVDEIGFRKLALHRMSFSGLGFKAGGPIGGKTQKSSEFTVGERWTRPSILNDIRILGRRLRRFDDFQFTNIDFSEVISHSPIESFIYLDPPYVDKGPALYKFAMSDADHMRLRDELKVCNGSWVLSYDDHEMVRDLYSWAKIESVNITYTMEMRRESVRPKNCEVVIMPKKITRTLTKSA